MDDEYGQDSETLPDDLNTEEPEIETAAEYGYTEPPIVPPPAEADTQNPNDLEATP